VNVAPVLTGIAVIVSPLRRKIAVPVRDQRGSVPRSLEICHCPPGPGGNPRQILHVSVALVYDPSAVGSPDRAALEWAGGGPGAAFVAFDDRLREAAQREGFETP
jgi:hypothetical protein